MLVILVSEQLGQLAGIPVDHGEVERTEVLVEREVHQVVVDVEEEGALEVLRRPVVADPVQLVYACMRDQ